MNARTIPGLAVCLLCLSALAAACGGSTSDGTCSPVGFVTCSGNSVVTCAGDPGAESGTPLFTNCRATSQFCVESGISGSCSAPVLGQLCFERNSVGCGATDQLFRCVWVSEQPSNGVTGDVGVWRVQADCAASGQVCRIPGSACAAP